MQLSRFYAFTLILLSLLFGYIAYLVMRPFVYPFIWAFVMTILFYPVFVFLGRYVKWKPGASMITVLIILLLIVGPFSYMLISLGGELSLLSSKFEEGQLNSMLMKIQDHRLVKWFVDVIKMTFGIKDFDLAAVFKNNFSDFSSDMLQWVSLSMKNIAFGVINFIIMIFSLYFLLKDGPEFIKQLKEYMPFPDAHKDRLAYKVKDMVISTIYGGVTVGITQGIVGGIAFYFLGMSSPIFWGMMIALMSFVPIIGTFAIWGPASIILVAQGQILKGIILLLIGTLIISMIDNILKPLIIGGRTKMHTLIVFFSVLGGIKLFGLIGLIMGPLTIVLFISILEIFRHIEDDYVIIDSPTKKE